MTDDIRNVDEEVSALPIERTIVAFGRTLKELGVPFRLEPCEDGIPNVVFDTDDVDVHSDEFEEAFGLQLKLLVVEDMLEHGITMGELRVGGVDSDGKRILVFPDDDE